MATTWMVLLLKIDLISRYYQSHLHIFQTVPLLRYELKIFCDSIFDWDKKPSDRERERERERVSRRERELVGSPFCIHISRLVYVYFLALSASSICCWFCLSVCWPFLCVCVYVCVCVCVPGAIPKTLRKLGALKVLRLDQNRFSGESSNACYSSRATQLPRHLALLAI